MTDASDSTAASVTFPGDTQILVTAEFDAPAHVVYQAWTAPEWVSRWWAGHWGQVTDAEADLQPGGTWRYTAAGSDGTQNVFEGEYREIVPDERIVSTEMYQGHPEAGALNTVTFTENGSGRTSVQMLVQHVNQDYRNAHAEAGAEQAMLGAMERLGQLVSQTEGR